MGLPHGWGSPETDALAAPSVAPYGSPGTAGHAGSPKAPSDLPH